MAVGNLSLCLIIVMCGRQMEFVKVFIGLFVGLLGRLHVLNDLSSSIITNF